jgi:hypothetical protein
MDVPALYATAGRIDELAEVVQARAALIALHAATSPWRSPAARSYLTHLDDTMATVAASVSALHGFATMLRTHATRR